MNVDRFNVIFRAFNFRLEDCYISIIKAKSANILGDGNPSVLWHSMKTVVNFTRRKKALEVYA